MPERIETYCDGHLVKRIDQVNVGPTADKPYDQFVDGRYQWFIGGSEVAEEVAQALIRGWKAPAQVTEARDG